MSGPVGLPSRRVAELTWSEIDAVERRRAVVILPLGALEAHGPHLPLATDVLIAEAMAEAGAGRLAGEGLEPLVLPAVTYTAAPFAAEFPGTTSVDGELVRRLVAGVAEAWASHGFRVLALANAHFDPAHLEALYAACDDLEAAGAPRPVFPDVTRKPWALRLTEELKSGACHAGRYEGSIVMATRPAQVREEIRRTLPANPTSLSVGIREGKTTFGELGGDLAYFGDPAAASAAEGEETIEVLGGILAEAVLERLAPP